MARPERPCPARGPINAQQMVWNRQRRLSSPARLRLAASEARRAAVLGNSSGIPGEFGDSGAGAAQRP